MNDKNKNAEEILIGNVDKVTYHNLENGFCILKIKVNNKRELITLVGSLPSIFAGEQISAQGIWINTTDYGLQFKASLINTSSPSSLESLGKYLSSGLIKGIGTYYAGKLIKEFGEDVFLVIEKHPSKLSKIDGIGAFRAEQISKAWVEQKTIREIMIFLQSHSIGTARATRIYKTYGEHAIELISKNPYRLAKDIIGIGFIVADGIARKLGISSNSIIRAQSGINYVLLEATSEGNCGLPKGILIERAIKLLNISNEILYEALENSINNHDLVEDTIENAAFIFLASYYENERVIASKIKQLLNKPLNIEVDTEKTILWVEEKLAIKLADKQKEAVLQALKSKVMVITGGPGTGKTTLIKSIVTILKNKNFKIKLAAPTGRAAKRLTETSGIEAKTIHRLLEFTPGIEKCRFNEENLIDADLIIIDEASMIDTSLMAHLLKAIPENCSLIIVGDIDQLPSVGPGNVLKDIIESNIVKIVRLTEIYRQAANSLIITNAHRINQGLFPEIEAHKNNNESDFYFINAQKGEDLFKKTLLLIKERIPQKFGFDPINDIQVLTPTYQGGSGAYSFNIELQKILNPPNETSIEKFGWKFTVGDKVIQTENNYDKEIYNGDLGIILSINQIDQEIVINFDGRKIMYEYNDLDQLSLAYAITIHKSQGSEYPVVIIPILMQHYKMLKKNLIYTAVTRGKKLVIIIGEKEALNLALKEKNIKKRYSKLKEMLCINK